MPELTLESLAARVEAIERTLNTNPTKQAPIILPATSSWEAALKAVEELKGRFDFAAIEDQNRIDWAAAGEHLP